MTLSSEMRHADTLASQSFLLNAHLNTEIDDKARLQSLALFSGFYKRSIEERHELVHTYLKSQVDAKQKQKNLVSAAATASAPAPAHTLNQFKGQDEAEARELRLATDKPHMRQLLNDAMPISTANNMIENCIGTLSVPLAICPSLMINGRHYVVPLATEESSVVAAASAAAKFIAEKSLGGRGFEAESSPNLMTGQIQILHCTDLTAAAKQISKDQQLLLAKANEFCPSMLRRGGGVKQIRAEVRQSRQFKPQTPNATPLDDEFRRPFLVVSIQIDVCEAMGANLVNTVCEGLSALLLERLRMSSDSNSTTRLGLRILTNYCEDRMTTVKFRLPVESLAYKGSSGSEVARRLLETHHFAYCDPRRACTNNKGIMNGMDACALATGQDTRAIEAAAHMYASRDGQYSPLANYWLEDEGSVFCGAMSLPIAVGTVGGALSVHPSYQFALQLMNHPSAAQLAQVHVAIGLCSNFAAQRALCTEGIQKSRMALQSNQSAYNSSTLATLPQSSMHLHFSQSASGAHQSMTPQVDLGSVKPLSLLPTSWHNAQTLAAAAVAAAAAQSQQIGLHFPHYPGQFGAIDNSLFGESPFGHTNAAVNAAAQTAANGGVTQKASRKRKLRPVTTVGEMLDRMRDYYIAKVEQKSKNRACAQVGYSKGTVNTYHDFVTLAANNALDLDIFRHRKYKDLKRIFKDEEKLRDWKAQQAEHNAKHGPRVSPYAAGTEAEALHSQAANTLLQQAGAGVGLGPSGPHRSILQQPLPPLPGQNFVDPILIPGQFKTNVLALNKSEQQSVETSQIDSESDVQSVEDDFAETDSDSLSSDDVPGMRSRSRSRSKSAAKKFKSSGNKSVGTSSAKQSSAKRRRKQSTTQQQQQQQDQPQQQQSHSKSVASDSLTKSENLLNQAAAASFEHTAMSSLFAMSRKTNSATSPSKLNKTPSASAVAAAASAANNNATGQVKHESETIHQATPHLLQQQLNSSHLALQNSHPIGTDRLSSPTVKLSTTSPKGVGAQQQQQQLATLVSASPASSPSGLLLLPSFGAQGDQESDLQLPLGASPRAAQQATGHHHSHAGHAHAHSHIQH